MILKEFQLVGKLLASSFLYVASKLLKSDKPHLFFTSESTQIDDVST